MITPEQIDAHEFTTTRFKEGYDPDEVDHFLDRVIADYRIALMRISELQRVLDQRSEAPTQQLPTVYSDMDKLLAVAQQHADQTMADANGKAGGILAEADRTAKGILSEAQNEKDRILGQLTGARDKIAQEVEMLRNERSVSATRMANAIAALENN